MVALVAASSLLLYLDRNHHTDAIRIKIARMVESSKVRVFFTHLTHRSPCQAVIDEINEVNEQSAAVSLYTQSVMQENNELRRLLRYHAGEESLRNNLYITTKANDSLASSGLLLLSVGQQQGVQVGQAVINHQGLVGRVISAADNSAEVLLVTDPRFKLPVIMRDSREKVMFSGAALQVDLTNKRQKIFDGEMAMTLGDQKDFPSYIPLGVVRVINDGPVAVMHIDIFADITKLDYVMVIL
jgi:rod shape-determining protein MreC